MVCNRATSPSSSQGGQLSTLRNKFGQQPDLQEFNLATGAENLKLVPGKQKTKTHYW